MLERKTRSWEQEAEASLSYLASSRLTWAVKKVYPPKKRNEERKERN